MEENINKSNTVYRNCFVVFLDIMGFKNIINETKKDGDLARKIKDILIHIANEKINNDDESVPWRNDARNISVFSDSMVISYWSETVINGSLYHLLMDVSYICSDLIEKDVFFRGAITYGHLYHDKNICFGPALVDAYMIEEGVAVYPRVVIDDIAIEEGVRLKSVSNSTEEEKDFLKKIIKRDIDGKHYLDYLTSILGEIDGYDEFMKKIKLNIERKLGNKYANRIMCKYMWFANYYNQCIREIYSNPTDEILIKY